MFIYKDKFFLIRIISLSIYLLGINSTHASESLNYSGRLVNSDGRPVTGTVNLLVELAYSGSSTPPILCSKSFSNVPLNNGLFYLKVDFECSPQTPTQILSNVPAGETVMVRVTNLSAAPAKTYPFQAFYSVPYAKVSETSKQLAINGTTAGQVLKWDGTKWIAGAESGTEDGTVTQVNTGTGLTGGPITTTGSISIANAGVGTTQLVDAGVTDAKIATGITRSKLSAIPAAANYVLVNNGLGQISSTSFIALTQGGTGANNITDARNNLGLGDAAVLDTGLGDGIIETALVTSNLPWTTCLPNQVLSITPAPTRAIICIDNGDNSRLALAGGTMDGDIVMNDDAAPASYTNKITKLAPPTSDYDASTKKYVDDKVSSSTYWSKDGSNNLKYETANVGVGVFSGAGAPPAPTERLHVRGSVLAENGIKFRSDLDGSTINYVEIKAKDGLGTTGYSLTLPATNGNAAQVLTTDGEGILSWTTVATSATTLGADGGDIEGTIANPTIKAGSITNGDIAAGAAIDYSKLNVPNASIAQAKITGLVTDLAAKEPTIADGTTAQYWRGDKTWQTLTTDIVTQGLTNKYYSHALTIQAPLTGYSEGAGAVVASDTILEAVGKLQGQITSSSDNFVDVTGDTMTGPLRMGTDGNAASYKNIKNLKDPVDAQDAATKSYVLAQVSETSYWTKDGSNNLSYTAGNVGLGTSAPEGRLSVDGDVGIGAIANTNQSAHMLDIASNKGAIGNSAIRAVYTDPGVLTGSEFAAIAFRNSEWATIYANAGSGGAIAMRTDGEVNMMNGNVGIGTTTPGAKLHVSAEPFTAAGQTRNALRLGAENFGSYVNNSVSLEFSSSAASITAEVPAAGGRFDTFFSNFSGTTGFTEKMRISGIGNVGIGTTTPDEKLDVAGNIALTGKARFKSDNTNYVELQAPAALAATLTFNLPGTAGSAGNALITDGAGNLSWGAIATTSTAVGGDLTGTISNAQIGAGVVGTSEIADSSVTYAKMNLADGEIPQTKINGLDTSLSGKEDRITAGTSTQYWSGDKTWQTLNTTAVAEGTNLYFLDSRVRTALMSGYAVGTAMPVATTDTLVEAIGKLEAQIIANEAGSGQWDKSGSNISYSAGRVGIGTNSPSHRLHVHDSSETHASGDIKSSTTNVTSIFHSAEGDNRYFTSPAAGLELVTLTNHAISFGANKTGSSFPDLVILPGGNVGIGVPNPDEKLVVVGNMTLTGKARFKSDNTNFVEFRAPAALAATLTFNLPGVSGSSGNALITDGAGNLSWGAIATTSSAVGGDLTGTIANAQIGAGVVGTAELTDTSVTYAKLNLTDGDIPQTKINGLATSLTGKQDVITAGTSAQYWRGDKTWQTLNTTAVAEGTNLYFLDSRVRTALMSGYAVGTALPVAATDTLVEALGKLEAQIIANDANSGQWSKSGANIYYDSGNVGVGTSSPNKTLDIAAGSSSLRVKSGDADSHGVNINYSVLAPAVGHIYNSFDSGGLAFGGSLGADHMRINPAGNVGIGTTSPSNAQGWDKVLDVAGSANSKILATETTTGAKVGLFAHTNWTGTTGAVGTESNHPLRFLTNYDEKMRIDTAGNVGIGTATPSEKLHVIGNIYATGTVTSNSDRRLKTNIAPVQNSLDKLKTLNGVSYDWKKPEEHSRGRQLGVIAQDVEKVFPEAVHTDNKGIKSVAYMSLISPMIESVKELYCKIVGVEEKQKVQEKKIETLIAKKDQEIAKLAQENADMKSRFERLEKMMESQGRVPASVKAKK